MIFFFCFTLTIIVPSGSQDSPEIDLTFLKRFHISSVVNVNAKVFWDGLTQHMDADTWMHGPPGIGKTALAIKVANYRRETDKNTMVVYVNCKYIYSADDFAEKVLAQIYHYPSNNPISGLKTPLVNIDSNKFTIILLDNFEFLIHVDDWIENQQIEEPVDRIKAMDFGGKTDL